MTRYHVLFLICLLLLPGIATETRSDTIPDVHFAVFRFDLPTSTFKGVYEFSQPYRKSLPEPGYSQQLNIHWQLMLPADFGYTDVKSRLTGERILRATMVWMGQGHFAYPPDSLMSTLLEHGYSNPEPDIVIQPSIMYGSEVDPEVAWALVRDTDVIARLASHGSYEVYAWSHLYGHGLPDWSTSEFFVLAATHPPAPDDMAILDVKWPRTLATRNLPTTPEIVVHNFGDNPTAVIVRARMSGGYLSTRNIGMLLADASRVVEFDPVTNLGGDLMVFDFDFLRPPQAIWEDAYPENDTWEQTIRVTDQPVFRRTRSVPHGGIPIDFDGDGDLDIVQFGYQLHLWRYDESNESPGTYVDISNQSDLAARSHPRFAISEDFNADTHPDIVVVFWGESPQFLVGDGTGVFSDSTTSSGLSTVVSMGHALAFDKENDGDMDIIFKGMREVVMLNDGFGHFTNGTANSGIIDPAQTEWIAAGDLNNDGFSDLVFANWQNDAAVFINDGAGVYSKLQRTWGIDFGRSALIFDYDNDGFQDILLVAHYYDPSLLFRNRGDLTFEDVTAQVGGVPDAFHAAAGDFNEDGWLDLTFSNGALLMNTGGAFADTSGLLVDLPDLYWAPQRVYFVDLDGDGDLDVYGESNIHINQGVPPFAVGIDPERHSPVSPYLAQNYPNPFNPTTTIKYSITEQAHVSLKIYNVAGQLVRTLVNEYQMPIPEGFAVTWDGRNETGQSVATGIYFYRLVAKDFAQTRKMVLLK